MRHPIDPLVDYAFKSLLGDPANTDLLVDFLNAVVKPEPPIVSLEIINPFCPEEFDGDDHRVLDVRARTPRGAQVQLEVQLSVHAALRERVLYTWSDVYQSQLQRGDHFPKLRPVLSVWVFRGAVIPDSPRWHHHFQLWDPDAGVALSEHCQIHTVELKKWRPTADALAAKEAWLYFLSEGREWTELPPALQSPAMEKAMSVLTRISEKSEDYERYQSRMNFLRVQATFEGENAELKEEREALLQELDSLEAKKSSLEAEKSSLEAEKRLAEARLAEEREARVRLEAKLRALGISPD